MVILVGTVNSAANPAKPGDVEVFYVSGLGETNPLSADGLVNAPPLPVPAATVTIYVNGMKVQPKYSGAAPGQIAGIVQINLQLPAGSYGPGPLAVSLNGVGVTASLSQ